MDPGVKFLGVFQPFHLAIGVHEGKGFQKVAIFPKENSHHNARRMPGVEGFALQISGKEGVGLVPKLLPRTVLGQEQFIDEVTLFPQLFPPAVEFGSWDYGEGFG
jgi:hypothetical protein